MSRAELRGLLGDLRPAVPALARLTRGSTPLLKEVRLASSCQNEVVLPWTQLKIDDPAFPTKRNVGDESTKFLPGIAGESRSGDANGQWFRVLLIGGQYAYPEPGGTILQSASPLGVNPPPPAQLARPYRPDVPCETQEKPDLRSYGIDVPNGRKITIDDPAGYQKVVDRAVAEIKRNLPKNIATKDRSVIDAALGALGK
jgi:hypothetical protein